MTRYATRVLSLVLSAGMILLIAGCGNAKAVRSFDLTHAMDFGDAPEVIVKTRNGAISVVVDPTISEMRVDGTITCKGATQTEANERAEMTRISIQSDVGIGQKPIVTVNAEFPKPTQGGDGASMTIRIPRVDGLNLNTGNGRVTCEDTTGDLVIETSNGAITVKRHVGLIDGRSSNGRVTLEDVDGRVKARTSNGALVIRMAEHSAGPVNARTSNGSVTFQPGAGFGGELRADTSNGSMSFKGFGDLVKSTDIGRSSMHAVFVKAGEDSTIDTSNGSVKVSRRAIADGDDS